MGASVYLAMIITVTAQVDEVLNAQNLPGLAILSASGLAGMFFVVRQMVKFQREFTTYYVEENKKLRDRVDELEAEVRTKDQTIASHERTIGQMNIRLDDLEATVARQQEIIERRKLERRKLEE